MQSTMVATKVTCIIMLSGIGINFFEYTLNKKCYDFHLNNVAIIILFSGKTSRKILKMAKEICVQVRE